MKLFIRTLALAACCLLASGANALAAAKHKPVGHGKSSTPSHDKGREGATGTGASDAAASRAGAAETRAADKTPVRESVRQESRIEFDERMLKGQSAAGVIYLFQRTPSDWKSIVEVPDSFRARTVDVLTPAEEKK
jgi:hypothetical protein